MLNPKRFVFALVEEFTLLSFANAVEPLRVANLLSGKTLYEWELASENGVTVSASSGVPVAVKHSFADLPQSDYVFVISGINVQDHVTPGLKTALRKARRHGITVGGLCSGAYALVETGLMEGRRTAIHWEYHEALREQFPDIIVSDSVFVSDGPVVSASGGAATGDLMLSLIAEEHGEDLALEVSEQMVYAAVRAEGAPQKVSVFSRHGNRNPRLAEAIRLMREQIEQPMGTAEIAEQIGISTRQLERIFAQHLNTSPKRYILELRMERARSLLIQTEMSVTEVGIACGFSNTSHFSRTYRKVFGKRPSNQRRIYD
jgi:transcriptional regulator GlxA family with amidase domain